MSISMAIPCWTDKNRSVSNVGGAEIRVEHTTLDVLKLFSLISSRRQSSDATAAPLRDVVINFAELTDEACAFSGLVPFAFAAGVTKMELLHNRLGAGTCRLLSQFLPRSKLLRLKLGGNPLGDQGAIALAEGLQTSHSLVQLNLGAAEIGDAGVTAICNALLGNTSLTSLCLRNNCFGAAGMKAVSLLLTHGGCRLTDLQLRQNQPQRGGFMSLATAVSLNHSLNILELENTNLTAADVSYLCIALQSNRTIHALNLNRNLVCDHGVFAVAQLLRMNDVITTIGLRENQITAVGCVALAEVLRANAHVTGLDLGSNLIGDRGSIGLAQVLQVNSVLQSLDVSSNDIRVQGVMCLASTIVVNNALKHLDISSNFSGDRGAMEWAKVLRNNNTLTRLSLTRNDITIRGGKALASALSTNTTLVYFGVGALSHNIKIQLRKLLSRNRLLQHGRKLVQSNTGNPSLLCVSRTPSLSGSSPSCTSVDLTSSPGCSSSSINSSSSSSSSGISPSVPEALAFFQEADEDLDEDATFPPRNGDGDGDGQDTYAGGKGSWLYSQFMADEAEEAVAAGRTLEVVLDSTPGLYNTVDNEVNGDFHVALGVAPATAASAATDYSLEESLMILNSVVDSGTWMMSADECDATSSVAALPRGYHFSPKKAAVGASGGYHGGGYQYEATRKAFY